MLESVDVNDVISILNFIDDKRMNPIEVSDGRANGCVYTGEDGSHCIAGEIISRLGFPLPDIGSKENHLSVSEMLYECGYASFFTMEAINVLGAGQNTADDLTTAGDPYAWAMAKVSMMRQAHEYGF